MQDHPPIALVTGGGSGIGAAACGSLSRAGWRVIVSDIDDHAADLVARRVGGRHEPLDVADPAAWSTLVRRLAAEETMPKAVLLNAGLAGGGDLLDFNLDRYRTLFNVNVDGVVHGMRAFTPAMRAAAGGSITVTASMAGLTGVPFDPIYAMTKHAVIGLVRSCAASFGRMGIRLQAVCPGLADTPLLGRAKRQMAAARYPLVSAETVAEVLTECVLGVRTDEVTVIQAGREPTGYRFAGVPGPRGAHADLPERIHLGRIENGDNDGGKD